MWYWQYHIITHMGQRFLSASNIGAIIPGINHLHTLATVNDSLSIWFEILISI